MEMIKLDIQCPNCQIDKLHANGSFLECDECGHVQENTTATTIAKLQAEYPNAIITSNEDHIIVNIPIILSNPVKEIFIRGVVGNEYKA